MSPSFWLNAAGWLSWLQAEAPAAAPVDSYRFLHVTIDTPWHIFLFLLIGVFAPFILMVVLVWRNSWRKWSRPDTQEHGGEPGEPRSHDP